jgi:hypothetical protein
MAGFTYFVALPFDVANGTVVVGEPIECLSPAAAIERAQGLWKILGIQARSLFLELVIRGNFRGATVLRKFGDVPDNFERVVG